MARCLLHLVLHRGESRVSARSALAARPDGSALGVVVLLVAAVRIGRARGDEPPQHSLLVRAIGRVLRTTPGLHGGRFFAMAVLGLRSLYFVVAAGLDRMRHLKTGLAVILGFIAAKTLAHDPPRSGPCTVPDPEVQP